MPPTARARITESPQVMQQFMATGVAQVIVVLKSPAAAAAAKGPDLRRHFVTSKLSRDSAIHTALAQGEARAAVGLVAPEAPPPPPVVRVYPNLGMMLGNVRPAGLERLRRDPRVAAVTGAPELSLIRPREVSEARTAAAQVGWGLNSLDVPKLWEHGLTGKGVMVAHLDTGADGRHPALHGVIAHFAQFDDLGNQVTPAPAPFDTDEHGTHTAATVAGRSVSGITMGVAPGAQLASAIVIEGGNVIARVLGGLDWALANGAKVLSMSLGLRGWYPDFLPVIQILRARGVLPVIASGNEGPGTSRSPGNYAEALSVGAVDQNGNVAYFSSSQTFDRPKDPIVPDIVAPGVDIVSAVPGGEFKQMSGTSMATPHIAGLAALLFEANPRATIDQIEDAIFKSCTLPSGMSPDRGGRGVPNGPRALSALKGPVAVAGITVKVKPPSPPKGRRVSRGPKTRTVGGRRRNPIAKKRSS